MYKYLSMGALVIVVLGYLCTTGSNSLEITSNLNFQDSIFIFLNNLFFISVWFFFSVFGLPLLFGSSFLFNMGALAKQANVDTLGFVVASIPHGVGEIICVVLICSFTFKQYRLIYNLFKNNASITEFKQLYLFFFKKTFPFIIGVLAVSALLEVYVSNPLIRYFS
jgi:uncharacterized membrane protein SpoIIM required for sporulation